MTDRDKVEIESYKQNYSFRQDLINNLSTKTNNCVPILRFSQFKEVWNIKKLGSIADFLGTYSFSRNDEVENSAIRHIHYGDIHSVYSGIISEETFIPFINFENKQKILIQDNDIILADTSEDYNDLGKALFIKNIGNIETISGLHTFLLRFNSELPLFFYFHTNTNLYKRYMSKIGTGTSVFGINKSNMQKYSYYCPTLPEQQKIADFLTTYDKLITLQEEKITNLKLYKKGLLQRLYIIKNELIPKLRFNEFSSNWIEYTLDKVCEEVSEKNKTSEYTRVISVSNSKGLVDQSDQFDRNVASENLNTYKIIKKGMFAYNPSRINVGSIDLLRKYEDGVLSPIYVVFKTRVKFDSEFLYYIMKSDKFKNDMPTYLEGGVRKSLSFKSLSSMKYKFPSHDEQNKIANFLTTLDTQITKQESLLALYKEQKKGFLQKMFV